MIPRLGRSLGGGNGSPLQYSCLKNVVDRGARQAIYSPWSHKESDTTERLRTHILRTRVGAGRQDGGSCCNPVNGCGNLDQNSSCAGGNGR